MYCLDKARCTGETKSMSVAASPDGMGFFSNPIFLSAIFSLLTAQFLKAVVNIFRLKARNFREILVTFFWKTGGMPSSHSALAVSIATAIAIREGLDTSIFILAIFFALVVIRDAMGVRRAAGFQARTLNQLGKELNLRSGIPYRPVKEVHGHSPVEVLIGGLLGFFIALAFCTL